MTRFAIAAAIALRLLLPAPAAADDTEPIHVVFQASEGCPDATVFTAEVQARTARARIAGATEPARTFTVKIDTIRGRSHGRLTLDDERGPGAVREVSADKCDELVSALALITALAIDPRASTAPRPPPPRPPPPPPAPPPPRGPRPPWPRDTPLPWWGPIGPPLPVIPDPSHAPEARWRFASGVHLSGESALGPVLVLVTSGFVEVMRTTGGVLSPAIRLSFLKADTGFVAAATARARFRWTGGRIEGCPVHLALASGFSAVPCVVLDAGALDADGQGHFASAQATRGWVAPGLLGRLRWEPVERVFLEAEGGVVFPLVRDTFYFDPGITAHAVPPAGGFFGGGVGVHFP